MEPFVSQLQHFSAELTRFTRDAAQRWQHAAREAQRVGRLGAEQIEAAIDDNARWFKASLSLGQELAHSSTEAAFSALRQWGLAVEPSTPEPRT